MYYNKLKIKMKQTVKSLVFLLFLLIGKMGYAQKQVKLFYNENWIVTTEEAKAEYYRLTSFDEKGNPVGITKDYYITGELQGEGTFSYIDKVNNVKDVYNGICTWYHKNGKKAEQRNLVNNVSEGLVTYWDKNGQKITELELKLGMLNGVRKDYHSNGKVKLTRNYKNGKPAENWYTECDEFDVCKKVLL
jgi:antitoxin component YwqK of YwqJK toxin-antitoxin module